MGQVTGPEDLLGAAARVAWGFQVADVTAEEQGLLRRLGDAVTAPQRIPQCPLLILLGVRGAEHVHTLHVGDSLVSCCSWSRHWGPESCSISI